MTLTWLSSISWSSKHNGNGKSHTGTLKCWCHVSIVRAKVKGTAADTDDLVIYKANDKLERAYLYIQNLDAEKENYITVRNETESNTATVAKIGGGEFAFIPVAVDKTYECIATKVNTLIEYGVFGLDNSAVSLA